jgi:hypothetical protein
VEIWDEGTYTDSKNQIKTAEKKPCGIERRDQPGFTAKLKGEFVLVKLKGERITFGY